MQTELSDGIAILVASNDHIQAVITQMEEICHATEVTHTHTHLFLSIMNNRKGKLCLTSSLSPQENGQRHREQLADHFDNLVAILEERKQELVGLITKQQDDKLKCVRSLIRRHNDDLEAAVTLVQSAIQSLEEPHMPLFIQVGNRHWRRGEGCFAGFRHPTDLKTGKTIQVGDTRFYLDIVRILKVYSNVF